MRFLFYLSSATLTLATACSPDRAASGLLPAEAVAPAATANRQAPGTTGQATNRSVHQFTVPSITGQPVSLRQYRGRKLLIVNTASFCRYTPQYRELEQLWQRYGNHVVVLGFPCNQFGGQEPGTDSTINAFCTNNYSITFPLFQRVDVNGTAAAPLYQFLTNQARNGVTSQRPTWNFCKYLVDENGYVKAFYPSSTSPLSPVIIDAIMR
jgi:glutathione peroxidase